MQRLKCHRRLKITSIFSLKRTGSTFPHHHLTIPRLQLEFLITIFNYKSEVKKKIQWIDRQTL